MAWNYPYMFGGFQSELDVFEEFWVPQDDRDRYVVLVATYDIMGTIGEAFVLAYDQTEQALVEINATHCSCYALEGQWSPEKVVSAEIIKRPWVAQHRDADFANAVIRAVEVYGD